MPFETIVKLIIKESHTGFIAPSVGFQSSIRLSTTIRPSSTPVIMLLERKLTCRKTLCNVYYLYKFFIHICMKWTLTNLFEIWLVGGIIFNVEAQNHPLIWRGWNRGWSHPSTSPSHKRPAVCTSLILLDFIKLCTNVSSALVSRLTISMHIWKTERHH